jgi:hypothetical protein
MNLKEIFEKQGGIKLLKQYRQGGALLTAIGEFLLLGKDKKGLEILRLSVQYKIKKKLEKKYQKTIRNFQDNYKDDLPHETSKNVWVCWFQGIEYAPMLVKKCYQRLKECLTDRTIILITADNINEYVKLPQYIVDKWKKGQISHTHMTDLLRLELLIKYGGMWIDATVFCTRPRAQIPDYFFDSNLFLYQTLKPGRDGQAQIISSWLISAKTNNKILMMTKYLCYEYWKKNTKMVDYFLLHDFLTISLEQNEDEWKKIIPQDNSTPHNLLLRMFDQYDDKMWNAIKEQTPFHKLTYKVSKEQTNIKGTYYNVLFEEE